MKRHILLFVGLLLAALPMAAQPSSGHYAGVDGKSGASLFEAVHTAACKGYRSLGYDGLYTAYRQTDSKDGEIWDMYSDCSFSYGKTCGSYKKECDCYNREHSVPQSWWGSGTGNQGCDIFHVLPTDGYVNNRRGNYPYGEVGSSATYTSGNGSKVGSSVISGYSGTVFEPIDEYKGDIARGILGVMVKWKGNWTKTATATSTFNNNYTASGNFGLTSYGVSLLLKWHREDPVSQKERDRNNGIEKTQGNRNPFIDYPCLVEYIWGTHKGERFVLSDVVSSYDSSFGSVDPSGCSCSTEPRITQPMQSDNVNLGSVQMGSSASRTFTLRGANLAQGLTLSISGTGSAFFTVSPSSVTAAQALAGQPVAVIYTPTAEGTHSAILTISSSECEKVSLNLSGLCSNKAEDPDTPVGGGDYVKVMKQSEDLQGRYLLVYEDESVCFKASGNVTASPNNVSVEIVDNTIASSDDVDANAVQIVPVSGGYALQLPNGDYISSGATKGNMTLYDAPQVNTISILNGTATITASNNTLLRYNTSAHCFRYYSSGQQTISLFKKTKSSDTADEYLEAESIVFRVSEGRLLIESAEPADVAIYDVMGRLLGQEPRATTFEMTLTRGLYVVRLNNEAHSVLVP